MSTPTYAVLKTQLEVLEEELLHAQHDLKQAQQPAKQPKTPAPRTVGQPIDILVISGVALFCAAFSLWLLTVWPALSVFMLMMTGVMLWAVRLAATPA